MANTIKLINTNITGSNGLKLLGSKFNYGWKNLTSEDPSESSYGNVESVFQGWENPQVSLTFFIPIDNSTLTDGTTFMNWAKWNSLVKNQYDGTSNTQTKLQIKVGDSDTSFSDYSSDSTSSYTTDIPVAIKSYSLTFSPDDSNKSGFWTVNAQLVVTK